MIKRFTTMIWKHHLLIGVTLILSLVLQSFSKNSNTEPMTPLMKVADFGLTDHNGNFHNLSYYDDHKAVVLFVQGNGCPIVRNALSEYGAIQSEFEKQGVKFFMINSNLQDTREKIKAEAEEFAAPSPILVDDQQLVAKLLDLRVTAEAILIDMESRTVIYRGPLSDRLGYESQKEAAQNNYLKDAIANFLTGNPIEVPKRKTKGCAITRMSDRWSESLTYIDDIAPILEEKCVSCHQEGGIAPWAMTDYKTIVGWSSMIKEVIYTKRMPPWHADKTIGHFSNDMSLSEEETETILAWIDGDMSKGTGDDPLTAITPSPQIWTLGEPDMVLKFKGEKIPATGIIDYRYQDFKLKFDQDVYVSAVEILPDKTEILHHVLATLEYPDGFQINLDRKRGPWVDGILAAWAPGMEPEVFPAGTGRIIPKGSTVHIQLHYTTNGKAQRDQSQIGFHFTETKPEREFFTIGPGDFDLKIKPHDAHHESSIAEKIYEDIRIFGFFPHMHYRGKAMKYILEKPNGERETLLSVPNYNFNWQRYYELEEPLDVAKGSKIIVEAVFDNSAQNTFNPNPDQTIYYGEQTFDEMMIGFFSFYKI